MTSQFPQSFRDVPARADMRDTVQSWIDQYADEAAKSPSRYWHPLSLPTFGADEIVDALDSMCRFQTSMGEKTRQFEQQFADWVGAADAVMVNSGSSADLLAAFLLTDPQRPRLQPGDEVLLPAVTWPTQIWSVLMAGLSGRLVDVDPLTLNMDLDDLRAKITPRTKAVFAVHLMGCPLDMSALREIAFDHNLIVLEDTCEALGAKWQNQCVGTFGLAGTFSFFFSHHMMTMEGGMVTCNDEETAARLRRLRAHGWARGASNQQVLADSHRCDPRYLFVDWGFNVRPTEVQAAFGLQQLTKLDTFHQQRNALARQFHDYIDQSRWLMRPRVPAAAEPAWFSLPVLVRRDAPFTRNQLTAALEAAGVETRPVVTGNLARQPAAKMFSNLFSGPLPGADQIHDQGLYVGLSPMFDARQMSRLIAVFEDCVARCSEQTAVRRVA